MPPEALVNVLEAAMLAAGRALTVEDFLALFIGSADAPDRAALRAALVQLEWAWHRIGGGGQRLSLAGS